MTVVEGKRAVVTGGGRGIGRALAHKLASERARVVVNDLDGDAAASVAAEIGGSSFAGNSATEAGASALFESSMATLGGIDLWFANAGIERGRGLDADEADWAASFEVNVMSSVRAARLLVPYWLEQGQGRLVVTASAAGLLTTLGNPIYSVTKHGAVAFAEWLAATYRHRGIVVQAICPLGVQTDMLDGSGRGRALMELDDVLAPEAVADAVFAALQDDRFLILPHPQVAEYYARRSGDTDRWLRSMNRIQQQLMDSPAEA